MMFAELPLSMRILLVLNPSIVSIMTKGLSWDCFTPLAFSSKKNMSLFVRLCFKGVFCGYCSLASDMISWGIWMTHLWMARLWLSLSPQSCLVNVVMCGPRPLVRLYFSLSSSLDLLGSPFFKNLCSFPFHMSSFISSFKSLQSFV